MTTWNVLWLVASILFSAALIIAVVKVIGDE